MNGIPTFQYKIFQLFLLINVVDTIFKVIYFTSMKNISIVITRSLVKKGPSNMHPFKKQQVLSLKKKKKVASIFVSSFNSTIYSRSFICSLLIRSIHLMNIFNPSKPFLSHFSTTSKLHTHQIGHLISQNMDQCPLFLPSMCMWTRVQGVGS